MNIPASWYDQRGQTIIEILIATAVVATILTAIAAGLTMTVRSTSQNKQRVAASSYAQDTIEAIRRERSNLGFAGLKDILNTGTYCFNELPASSIELSQKNLGQCDDNDMIEGSTFQREADIIVNNNSIEITSRVSWKDGNEEREVVVTQVLKDIE